MSNNPDAPDDLTDDQHYPSYSYTDDRLKNAEYIGAASGAPMFYDAEKDSLFEGDVNQRDRSIAYREGSEREVGAEETLGDTLERIGDELGWDSLSEFANDHLKDDDRS